MLTYHRPCFDFSESVRANADDLINIHEPSSSILGAFYMVINSTIRGMLSVLFVGFSPFFIETLNDKQYLKHHCYVCKEDSYLNLFDFLLFSSTLLNCINWHSRHWTPWKHSRVNVIAHSQLLMWPALFISYQYNKHITLIKQQIISLTKHATFPLPSRWTKCERRLSSPENEQAECAIW